MHLALLVPAVLAASVVFFQLACFVIALYEAVNLPEARHTRLTPASLARALGGFVIEVSAVLGFVFAWPLGFVPWRPIAAGAPSSRPILVFVPGWWMNRACFLVLRSRLARDGWTRSVGLNYRTIHGDLDRAAERLRDAVDRLCAQLPDARVVLIGHSMGGIVCRRYLRDLAGHHRVRSVITLGTPHQGSKLSALSVDPMVQDLRPGSAFMERLAHDDPIPGSVDFTAIYSSFDHLVVPAANGYYEGVGNIVVEGVGHMGLLWSSRVSTLVRECLEYGGGAESDTPADRRDVGASP